MTRITIQHIRDVWHFGEKKRAARNRRKREDFWCFKAQGHATGAPEVCGGVSALLCTLAIWLEQGPGPWSPVIRMEPGETTISFIGGREAGIAARVTETGLRAIAARYPEAVEVHAARCGHHGCAMGHSCARGPAAQRWARIPCFAQRWARIHRALRVRMASK